MESGDIESHSHRARVHVYIVWSFIRALQSRYGDWMGCSTAREAYSRNSKWMPRARARFIDAGYSMGIARRFCHREAHRHGNTSEISARIVYDVYIIAGTMRSRLLHDEMIRIKRRRFARVRTLGNTRHRKIVPLLSLSLARGNPTMEGEQSCR